MKIAIYGTDNYAKLMLEELDKIQAGAQIVYFVEYQKRSDTFEKREEINAYDISFDEFA